MPVELLPSQKNKKRENVYEDFFQASWSFNPLLPGISFIAWYRFCLSLLE